MSSPHAVRERVDMVWPCHDLGSARRGAVRNWREPSTAKLAEVASVWGG